jgi:predicted metal-dependent enzyme (double-stranded beta helix superfamily)
MSAVSDTQCPPLLSRTRLEQIARTVASCAGLWHDLVRFETGERWYCRLQQADDHEVWLLSWLPGQWTGFHDHGGSAGAFVVARGTLDERTVVPGGPGFHVRTLAPGAVRSFGPRYVHDVVNTSDTPAVSVHAYAPPLTEMRRYELTSAGLVSSGTERAASSW